MNHITDKLWGLYRESRDVGLNVSLSVTVYNGSETFVFRSLPPHGAASLQSRGRRRGGRGRGGRAQQATRGTYTAQPSAVRPSFADVARSPPSPLQPPTVKRARRPSKTAARAAAALTTAEFARSAASSENAATAAESAASDDDVETAPSDVPVAATAAESAASDEDVKTASSAVATAAARQHKRQGPSPPTVEVPPSPTTNVTCPSAPFSPFVQVDGESGINPSPSPPPSTKSRPPDYSTPTAKDTTAPASTPSTISTTSSSSSTSAQTAPSPTYERTQPVRYCINCGVRMTDTRTRERCMHFELTTPPPDHIEHCRCEKLRDCELSSNYGLY